MATGHSENTECMQHSIIITHCKPAKCTDKQHHPDYIQSHQAFMNSVTHVTLSNDCDILKLRKLQITL